LAGLETETIALHTIYWTLVIHQAIPESENKFLRKTGVIMINTIPADEF